ncbi:magnesium chelatase subunit D [Hydrogenophaga sp. IBVHS1]|uniref:magnesium chelatase subunit D n=1 Tax=Hydrogenophaga sp. IBVHS1 TaxID=1985169 RepID=UPI000A2DC494|nr:magnesium chelatase subunit D [Hydrogenophaga sp. IBVHS1]OSZ75131.1 magnesium chelatase ATPase subunit D [Hydrogenophaga sp. IBVHS1]
MFELAPPKLRADAAFAAALCAVDPVGLGGVALRASASPLRAAWLNLLKTLQPAGTPWLRLPHHATDAALLGGLDLAATLHAGRPVAQRGLLARADGGWLLLAMAERCGPNVAAHLSAALDLHEVRLQREGLAHTAPARFGLVALDEGQGDDERLPATLLDRLAFQLVLEPASAADDTPAFTPHDIEQARAALPAVRVPDELVQALCGAALAWGVASLRAPLMALRAVRAAAALAGLEEADESHAALAARLVLAPRATRVPAPPEPQEAEAEEPPPPSEDRTEETQADEDNESSPADPQALEDQLIEAMQSALPPGLLAALQAGQQRQAQARAAGTAGALQKHAHRGRPVGTRRGEPRAGARLHVLDTLRAAAPWQRLRQRDATPHPRKRIEVRREDFHVVRHRQHRPTTTVFVVDASGSAALHRLAEAKGAVELLLAECYVRRDKVAVLAFRGAGADLLLPPTRSLARAKRALAALPGGGGTPLANAISAALELAQQIARAGDTPVTVFLTDGRANIDRHGAPGRAQATQDAKAAAEAFAVTGLNALLIDTSPQPADAARELSQAMGATYIPLPYAGAAGLTQAVLLAQPAG